MSQTITTRGGLAAGTAFFALSLAASAAAQTAPPPPATPLEAIEAGQPILEVRLRSESVDQTKAGAIKADAQADTVRARFGWASASWDGLSALAEGEVVQHIGAERFAVNTPGVTTPPLNGADKARFPLVNDPDVVELNRLQLAWRVDPRLTLTLGRQRILIDDQRFVGNAGWRQDEQTFDAARADLALGRVTATYAYLTRINRTLGDLRDWRSDSHILNAAWNLDPRLRLEAFLYALDFSNSLPNSSLTRGVKASGHAAANGVSWVYDATWARQSDWRHATPAYGLDYWSADLAGTWKALTGKAAYEQLDGNGTRGFTTPLATTHSFQGWADAWVQPLGGNKGFVDGLKDLNLTAQLKPAWTLGRISKPDLLVRWHDFHDERTGAFLAHEWDGQAAAQVAPGLTAALKYARFSRAATVPAGTATPPASRTKVWFTLEYRL